MFEPARVFQRFIAAHSGYHRVMSSATVEFVSQPSIACPRCGAPVLLTEALAAPLLEATRSDYESKLRAKENEYASQVAELRRRETAATAPPVPI